MFRSSIFQAAQVQVELECFSISVRMPIRLAGLRQEGSALSMQPTARGAAGALRDRRAGLGAVDIHRGDDIHPGPQDIGKHRIAHAHRCVYDDGAK